MAASDGHERFVEEMMRCMAFRPLFSGVRVSSAIPEGLPWVAVERGHLLDTLFGLCELLVASGGSWIVVDADTSDEEVRLTLSTLPGAGRDLVSDRKVAFYTATLQLYAARFAVHREGGRLTAVLHLPVADGFDAPIV